MKLLLALYIIYVIHQPTQSCTSTSESTTPDDECAELERKSKCSDIPSNPVICGSDKKTYKNKCLFDIAQCKDPSLKEKDEQEFCGAHGRNTDNAPAAGRDFEAELDPEDAEDELGFNHSCPKKIQVPVTFQGAEKMPEECYTRCKGNFDDNEKEEGKKGVACRYPCPGVIRIPPICGSDHQIYQNKCFFQVAQCNNPELKEEDSLEPCICNHTCKDTPDDVPICASDGKRYPNECHYKNMLCTNPYISEVNITCCDDDMTDAHETNNQETETPRRDATQTKRYFQNFDDLSPGFIRRNTTPMRKEFPSLTSSSMATVPKACPLSLMLLQRRHLRKIEE